MPRLSLCTTPLLLILLVLFSLPAAAQAPEPPEMARIDAGMGPCSVTFEVVDEAGKPLYEANIYAVVKHGFMNLRKTELEVGTNVEGKAQFTGLPRRTKEALWFEVRHRERMKRTVFDPRLSCQGWFPVILRPEDREEEQEED